MRKNGNLGNLRSNLKQCYFLCKEFYTTDIIFSSLFIYYSSYLFLLILIYYSLYKFCFNFTSQSAHSLTTVSGLTSSEGYPKALFLALFFSMFLLMIFFTFWISPLSTIMLMITPCLMLTQILTLSFTPCYKTVLLHYSGSISTR